MVSTDNTVKLAPGVSSVVKLSEGPVQEMVGTGLPCAVQLNVAGLDWFTVRSTGESRMKGWAGWEGRRGRRWQTVSVGDTQWRGWAEKGWRGDKGESEKRIPPIGCQKDSGTASI